MRIFSFLLLLTLLQVSSALGPGLRAQTNWTLAASGTTQNLWGVCYGGGQFVAVGENGTILTSTDGSAWTARAGGTTVWLTSVTYALAHYIAVGDNGTVLSSQDGVVWDNVTARTPGAPTTRLNVVRFDGTEFLAYGEHNAAIRILMPVSLDWNVNTALGVGPWLRSFATGLGHNVVGGEAGVSVFATNDPFLVDRSSALVPTGILNVSGLVLDHDTFIAVGGAGAILVSTDTATWVSQTSGTTANLQDIASFNNTLIAVGDSGTILSLDEHGTWTRRNAPTGQLLLGVASSDTVAVSVGFGGTILCSAATLMPPTILVSPASVTETLGGAAAFVVRANGSLPLTYQWLHNNVPLASETTAALMRAPLTAADAGSYTVTITNSAGTVTTSAASLNLLPAPAPVVDMSFHADPSLDGSPSALLPLADGSVLVADGKKGQLVKLRSDGSLDPAWARNIFGPAGTNAAPYIDVLTAQPDGRILVGGTFATLNSQPNSNLIRLNRDGTIDLTFAPAVEATSRTVYAIALDPDNRVLVANGGLTPIRLLVDGSLDLTFLPQPLEPAVTIYGEKRNWSISSVAAAGNGKVVVAAEVSLTFTNILPLPNSTVVRFQGDGAADASFTPLKWSGGFTAMRVLDDDGVLVIGYGPATPDLLLASNRGLITRLRSDGSPNTAYVSPTFPPNEIPYGNGTYIYPNGAVLVIGGSLQNPVRFTPLGAVDPGFTGGIGDLSTIAATNNNQVYVAGSFSLYYNKPSQRVARLNSVANGSLNPPRILSFVADKATVSYGDTITVRAAVTGSADLTFEWDGAPSVYPNVLITASPTLTFTFQSRNQPDTLRLVARNPSGAATSVPIVFTVLPDPPVITSQPTRVSAQSGRDLTLPIGRNDNSGNTVDVAWSRNGQFLPPMPWYLGPTLNLSRVTAADAGIYTVTLRNALGVAVTSAPILLTIDDSSRFANLSARALVGPGEQTLIAGFSISGVNARTVLLRGIGPALAKFGVTSVMPDPQITVFSGATRTDYFSSGGWDENSQDGAQYLRTAFASVGAFPPDPGSKDVALTATVAPGNYTVQLSSRSGQTGTALIEIYEYDNDAARMLNVSSRAMIMPGTPAIGGLSIQGPVAKRVLLRAVGPALGAFSISGTLANPRLTLKDPSGITIATNDDWGTNANLSDFTVAMTATGAFQLPTGSKDAALLVTLAPGNYTMIVEGEAGQSGVALIEAYEVP